MTLQAGLISFYGYAQWNWRLSENKVYSSAVYDVSWSWLRTSKAGVRATYARANWVKTMGQHVPFTIQFMSYYEVVHGSSFVLIAFADFFPLWMFVTDRVFFSDSVICFESGWMFFRLVCSWKGKLTNFFSLSVLFLSFFLSLLIS